MKCFKSMKDHYGEDNFNLVDVYNNIGSVYSDQQKLEEGLEMFMKSLNILKAQEDSDNLNLGITYKNISEVYANQ